MSLIDPSTRWWNRYGTRRVAAAVAAILAFALAFGAGWDMSTAIEPNTAATVAAWRVPVFSSVSLLLSIGSVFLMVFGTDSEDFHPRTFAIPIASLFLGMGAGDLAHAVVDERSPDATALSFLVLAVIGLAIVEIFGARSRRRGTVQAQVNSTGRSATGIVTRARSYSVNYQPVTRVTVKFTDHTGRDRWVSDTISGTVSVGAKVPVRFLPEHLDRAGSVVVG